MKCWRGVIIVIVILLLLTTVACCPGPSSKLEEGIVVISHSSYVDASGVFHIVGEVHNVGTTNTKENEVMATLYNTEGEIVSDSLTFAYLSILSPSKKSPFEIMLFRPPADIQTYELETSWENTSENVYADMRIQDLTSHIGEEGGYWVEGNIENIGGAIVDMALIVGTFYDGSGRVVATGVTLPEVAPLHPGQVSPFRLVADPDRASLIQSFTVQTEGYLIE